MAQINGLQHQYRIEERQMFNYLVETLGIDNALIIAMRARHFEIPLYDYVDKNMDEIKMMIDDKIKEESQTNMEKEQSTLIIFKRNVV